MTKGRSFFVKECGINILQRRDALPSRIGIVVPKKLTRTIARRNYFKRQVRNIFLQNLRALPHGFDIVFVARSGFGELPFEDKRTRIVQLLERARLLLQEDTRLRG